jgi:hypothetical protein
VKLGAFEAVMLDSSAAANRPDPAQTATFAAELSSVRPSPGAWLVDHHPFWLITGENGVPQTVPLQEAWARVPRLGVDLVLSGHVHIFAVLSFDTTRPVQIVAGNGGTILNMRLREAVDGRSLNGATILSSETREAWGYSVFTREPGGWQLALASGTGADETMAVCRIRRNSARCTRPK